MEGIVTFEQPFAARFFTLTFPEHRAPNETEAQLAWSRLVKRLRYRSLLGDYGWVLQRQRNGSLHFHGIAEMCHMGDGLDLWRRMLQDSGFGVQNKLLVAEPSHARYCARYISRNLADLAPLRRAYSFSPGFPKPVPQPPKETQKDEIAELLSDIADPNEQRLSEKACVWISEMERDQALRAQTRRG